MSVFAQTDSLPATFFPSQIGDKWNYEFSPGHTFQTELTRDSIADGKRYLFFDASNTPLYEIDSALNVTINPLRDSNAWLTYKLTANKNEVWTVRNLPGGRIAGRVDSVYWDIIFGKLTQVKAIGYYRQALDTTFFFGWLYEDYLASGFGLYLEIADASQTPEEELIGCIIDGKKYGTVVSVKDTPAGIPSDFKLFPAFPNPFNPATMISYSLPLSGKIEISVYNMLGINVNDLVHNFQEAGEHSILFQPENLPSGV